jgi:hypothetical protein
MAMARAGSQAMIRALQAAIRGNLVRGAYRAGKGVAKYGGQAVGAYDTARMLSGKGGKRARSGPDGDDKVLKRTTNGAVVPSHNKGGKKNSLRGGGHGKFAGKFPKGNKKAMNKQSLTKYNVSGASTTRETVGTVADSDCVYIYAHTHAPIDMVYNISKALTRKLCEKAFKCKYTANEALVLGGTYSPTLGKYKWVITNVNLVTGAQNTQSGDIDGTTTLTNLATAVNVFLLKYSSGYGFVDSANAIEPFTLSVYKQLNTDTDSLLMVTLNLNDEHIDMQSTLELKVQNRSISASGSTSTDVVDSNPVQGYLYEFSSIPKTRDPVKLPTASTAGSVRAAKFGSIRYENGIQLIRGSELPSEYLEPIAAKSFTNCKGVARIRLEPGAIKHLFRTVKKRAPLIKFLQDFNVQTNDANVNIARVVKTIGGGVMLSFEDLINVNSTANISITYETEHRLGIRLYTRKSSVMVGDFTQNTFNNLPV